MFKPNKYKPEEYFETGNLIDRIFLLYNLKIIGKAKKGFVEKKDILRLKDEEEFQYGFDRYKEFYQKKRVAGWSFEWIFFRFISKTYLRATLLFFINNMSGIWYPFGIKWLINWFDRDSMDTAMAYSITLLFMFCCFFKPICQQHAFRLYGKINHMIFTVFFGFYFNKLDTVCLKAQNQLDIAKVSNSIAGDLDRVIYATAFSSQIIADLPIIIINSYFLYRQIGIIAFVGIILLIVFTVLQFRIGKMNGGFIDKKLQHADQRNNYIKNAISGIKVVKFNAWENVVYDRITEEREKEQKYSFLYILIFTILNGCSYIIPLFCSLSCIVLFMLTSDKSKQDLGTTFFIVYTFDRFQGPLRTFFYFIANYFETRLAFKRLNEFLDIPDKDEKEELERKRNIPVGECKIDNANFSYTDDKDRMIEQAPVLSGIDLKISRGEFVAIVGPTGSGKTSLIKALNNVLYTTKGTVSLNGKIGYVPQKAFLMNTSLKNNIVFGKNFSLNKYNNVIKYCELQLDLDMLPAGEDTEIGERGANLSGGQKQRINIARAVYSKSDIYLIDDSLSALDGDVGRKIFENVFMGLLKSKTRVLVTHALQYLEHVDKVVYMDEGKIVASGEFYDLMNNNKEFAEFIKKANEEDKEKEKKREREKEQYRNQANKFINNKVFSAHLKSYTNAYHSQVSLSEYGEHAQLLNEEKVFKGKIKFNVYLEYFFRYSKAFFILNIVIFFCVILGVLGAQYWVTIWQKRPFDWTEYQYALVYFGIGILTLCIVLVSAGCWAYNKKKNGFLIFDDLIKKIFWKKMSFFDTTPLGQLLNLCSIDVHNSDTMLPNLFNTVFLQVVQAIATFCLALIGNPLLIFVFASCGYVILYYTDLFLTAVTDVNRMRQNAVSPQISNFVELNNGLVLYRNYDQFSFISKKFTKNTNKLMTYSYILNLNSKFMYLFVECCAGLFVGLAILLMVLGKSQNWSIFMNKSGVIAVTLNSLSYLPSLSMALMFYVMTTVINMNSVQRLIYNIDDGEMEQKTGTIEPSGSWPQQGSIKAVDVNIKYRPHLPNVLKNINFDIKGGEKIGVVGRTGSGKSTLMLALTRMLEISEGESGYFEIDGNRINHLDLSRVREAIAVIPQDPFLLKGSLRFNIDPSNKHDDSRVMMVLKRVFLWDSNMFDNQDNSRGNNDTYTSKLYFQIENEGKNLSVGQKQLICIARALLDRPKILLMDEATSNIDQGTDSMIQRVIREEFVSSTVITIAHRLNTIIDFDRIFVFDEGKLIEKGSLADLMARETVFRSIVKKNGNELMMKIQEKLSENK